MPQALTETPWLDDIIASVGVHEIDGPASNAKILAYYVAVGHPECTSEDIPWCAARTGAALKAAGYPIPPKDVCLMARSYCTYGVACEPKRGAIVVFPRGNSTWQGHVGVVVEVQGDQVKYIAGNQSDQVGYGTAPIAHALAFRWPVKPTVPDLRKAGSTEIKSGDRAQNTGTLNLPLKGNGYLYAVIAYDGTGGSLPTGTGTKLLKFDADLNMVGSVAPGPAGRGPGAEGREDADARARHAAGAVHEHRAVFLAVVDHVGTITREASSPSSCSAASSAFASAKAFSMCGFAITASSILSAA